jgi:hypothetical protein
MIARMQALIRRPVKQRGAIVILISAASIWLAADASNAAANYDGSTPFVCVPTAVAECVSEGECRPGTAESENLPDFFKVNLKEKTIGSHDKTRVSPIKLIDQTAGALTLYGVDADRSWVLMIQKKTGRMSASITGNGESFVIFGVCPLL